MSGPMAPIARKFRHLWQRSPYRAASAAVNPSPAGMSVLSLSLCAATFAASEWMYQPGMETLPQASWGTIPGLSLTPTDDRRSHSHHPECSDFQAPPGSIECQDWTNPVKGT